MAASIRREAAQEAREIAKSPNENSPLATIDRDLWLTKEIIFVRDFSDRDFEDLPHQTYETCFYYEVENANTFGCHDWRLYGSLEDEIERLTDGQEFFGEG